MRRMFSMLLSLLAFALPLSANADLTEDAIILTDDLRVTGQITSDLGVPIELDLIRPELELPDQALTVQYRRFTKRELQEALRAIGQSDMGTFDVSGTGCSYSGGWQDEASASISHEEAAAQAVQIGHELLAALGIDVAKTPQSIGRPYEWDDSDQPYWHAFSEAEAMSAYYEARFNSPRQRRTRPEQSAYTIVYFAVLLDGVPIAQCCSYPAGYADEPDARISFSTTASVTVSDSGMLVSFTLSCVPIVVSRAPLEQPLPSWQDAIEEACRNCPDTPSSLMDTTFYNEYIGMNVTHYARRPILTRLECLYETTEEFEWVPVWKPAFSYEVLRDGYRY
ncbi:MAG: hypothetical protein Q4G52_02875 [Clostridia bacterium]|nr:hypothetical protein [Clostridia bacterium]